MIHELAHATHSVIDEGSYDKLMRHAYIIPGFLTSERDDNKRLMESYASHIEITYMIEFYRRLGFSTYRYREESLHNQTVTEVHYTTLIFDLTDNENQRSRFGFEVPVDNVEGFRLIDIENSIKNARSLQEFRENVEALGRDNVSDIRQLFANW